MEDVISSFARAPVENRQALLRTIITALNQKIDSSPATVAIDLKRLAQFDLDYTSADALSRVYRKWRKSNAPANPTKIAILGNFTTHQLAGLLEFFLFAAGVEAVLYESDYGVMQQEILDASSGLHAFKPAILFLATNRRSLGRRPAHGDTAERVDELVGEEIKAWCDLWSAANASLGCQIIQNNFDAPAWRVSSNHEMRHPASLSRFIARVNHALQDAAPSYVVIHDVDHLAAVAGRAAWGDDRFYFFAKLPCAPEFLAGYARSAASIVGAMAGQSKKCLVLDLDNTLWGGVIGDDGIAGIRLGQGDPEGEAFAAFQEYCLELSRRGIILAVCSKNTESIAKDAFAKHPEMILRLENIACFMANWDDKATNLRRIAKALEIGLNSLVFVDDNPAERDLVRQLAPEVSVPELPEDPSGYIQAVDRHAYFQTTSLSAEDFQRGAMYQANTLRQEAESASGNIDGFLRSLEMKARVEPLNATNLDRAAQLVARSNQFNLTTRRHSAAALAKMAESNDWLTMTISLNDRFGDNGLISVLLARIAGEELIIDTWLMSCRVLKRGVEAFARNRLCSFARERGARAVVGEYIPTAKNALVREHYANLEFKQVSVEPDQHSWWRLDLREAADLPNFITEGR